ncbi:MAG TPA: menaquinone-dependent protoporphyrinogen IX dehydrogenase [Gammaproteobacteria bacterium]
MARLLIAYGTTEGQTAKIAAHIGDAARRVGLEVAVCPAAEIDEAEPARYDAIVVGGSLHDGRYQRAVRDFVARHRELLAARPSAFFSVSLAAASRDPAERAEAMRIARDFTAAAGWTPRQIASFAGALKYTQYSWLKRALMKHIARKEGGDTDTSRDFEYTDWDDVTRFAEAFAREVAAGAAAG